MFWLESAVRGGEVPSLSAQGLRSLCPAGGLFLSPASQNPVWCRRAFPAIGPKTHSHLFLRSLPPSPFHLPQQRTPVLSPAPGPLGA